MLSEFRRRSPAGSINNAMQKFELEKPFLQDRRNFCARRRVLPEEKFFQVKAPLPRRQCRREEEEAGGGVYPSGSDAKKGSVLVLSLIITMIVLASAVVLGTIIISAMKRAQLQTASFSAYYAAESRMERALYLLRKEKKKPSEVLNVLKKKPDCSDFQFGTSANVNNCSIQVTYKTQAYFPRIKKNSSAFVQLVDPQGNLNAGVERVEVFCSGGWLEVTATVIAQKKGSWMPDPGSSPPKKWVFSCPELSSYSIKIEAEKSYLIELKALYDDAVKVRVQPFDSDNGGVPKSVGDHFTIVTGADFSFFSRQEIVVEVPGISSASSFFDYVIYSEQDIEKDIQPQGSPF